MDLKDLKKIRISKLKKKNGKLLFQQRTTLRNGAEVNNLR